MVRTGNDVTAANAAVAQLPVRANKLADTTIASDATLTSDADLQAPIAAHALVLIRAKTYFTTSAAADFKYRITGPASPTRVRIKRQAVAPGDTALSEVAVDTAYSGSDISVPGGAGSGVIEIEAVIANGATAGNFGISWAQNTSDASDTTVEAGSYIEVIKLPIPIEIAFDDDAIAKLGAFTGKRFRRA